MWGVRVEALNRPATCHPNLSTQSLGEEGPSELLTAFYKISLTPPIDQLPLATQRNGSKALL